MKRILAITSPVDYNNKILVYDGKKLIEELKCESGSLTHFIKYLSNKHLVDEINIEGAPSYVRQFKDELENMQSEFNKTPTIRII